MDTFSIKVHSTNFQNRNDCIEQAFDNIYKQSKTLEEALALLDESSLQHSKNVATLCCNFSKEIFSWENSDMAEAMYIAGLYHDIGKLLIPQSILRKPDALCEIEREIVQNHSVIGYQLLNYYIDRGELGQLTIGQKQMVLDACKYHHERVDGLGYGIGIKEIPVPAKVCSVADVYDAVKQNRPYHIGVPTDDAKQIIVCAAGTQLDNCIVSSLMSSNNSEMWEV